MDRASAHAKAIKTPPDYHAHTHNNYDLFVCVCACVAVGGQTSRNVCACVRVKRVTNILSKHTRTHGPVKRAPCRRVRAPHTRFTRLHTHTHGQIKLSERVFVCGRRGVRCQWSARAAPVPESTAPTTKGKHTTRRAILFLHTRPVASRLCCAFRPPAPSSPLLPPLLLLLLGAVCRHFGRTYWLVLSLAKHARGAREGARRASTVRTVIIHPAVSLWPIYSCVCV